MTQQDYADRTVTEAEQLVAAGDIPRALDKLETAARYVPWWDEGETTGVVVRIEALLDRIAADDPSTAPHVEEIRGVLANRERGGARTVVEREPWFYPYTKVIANVAVVMSVLSLIGGIVVGIEASRYRSPYNGETSHHAGVIIAGVLGAVLGAALWLAVAAGLNLLVDIGRMLRESRDEP
jgi:hypothetical protein